MRKLGFLSLSFLLLAACSSLNYKSLRKQESLWSLSWTSGSCFRSCPVYNAHIDQNGILHFTGIRHCKQQGDTSIQLEDYFQYEVLDSLESKSFLELDSAYGINPGVMDVPINGIELSSGKRQKQVRYQLDAPDNLNSLIKWLNQVLRDQELI